MKVKELKICSKAPCICSPDQNGNQVGLKDVKGKWVVLYFYPKDNTSGCTVEAVNFTEKAGEFESMGAVVIGGSPDSCQSHQKFILKHNLKLTLISDTEKQVMLRYGVWKEKKRYGRTYMGVERSTFLIDPSGKIAAIWRNVKVKGHAAEVMDKLKELTS